MEVFNLKIPTQGSGAGNVVGLALNVCFDVSSLRVWDFAAIWSFGLCTEINSALPPPPNSRPSRSSECDRIWK